MATGETAAMAMIWVVAMGFLLSDSEKKRVHWVRAMRRCLLRMNGIIRYEQPGLSTLLRRIDLHVTPQEKALTKLLHACADRLDRSSNPQLLMLFAGESVRMTGYGVLSETDKAAFEAVLGELGRMPLTEQIRLIDEADERLRAREEILMSECARRSQMIRALSMAGGAAVFLILI